jgi:inhibitor of KinA sporulation pathway (predicted exonuclease)
MIIIDIEATCWKNRKLFQKENQETIEIGAVKLNPEMTEVVDEFQIFIKPVIHPSLSDFCTELTTITQADVDNAPLFKEAWETHFLPWIGEETRFGSWGNFDLKMLKKDCERSSSEFPFKKFCNISRTCYGSRRKAGRRLGIKFEGTRHRAHDDARHGGRLFVGALKEGRKYKLWNV